MNRPVIILLLLVGCKISRTQWVERYEKTMVDLMCKPEQYFRTCFDVDEATCRSLAKRALEDCIPKATLPDELDEQQGRTAGGEIGSCAGGAVERKLREDKHAFHADNAICTNPDAWRGK